jgi:DNA-3-methyladenine glycosylase
MQRRVLGPDFFNRPTLTVAKELLGKYLVRKVGSREVALMIVETEGYDGQKDLACHARAGRTARNEPMWGQPGRVYVYFTYGMHWMLNLVVREEGYPAAVLIRGLSAGKTPRSGEINHTPAREVLPLLNGPAKLTKFLQIDKRLNGKKLGRASGLWVEDRGVVVGPRQIKRGPRVGVDYAGLWALKPWRFVLKSERAGT